jgi:hypothetical protein
MPETLNHVFASIHQMMHGADIDYAILAAARLDSHWFADYENQRIVNSFLFNYLKIQDKIGGKLFRNVLQQWRELQTDTMTMLDILNRLEKLRIIDSVETWDKLREIRNAITHEYPEDIDIRLDNIRLALVGYQQMKAICVNIERALSTHQQEIHHG